MNALRILHMRTVDTALLYPHPNGPPYKPALRVLTERLLGRRIQDGSHDSVADAVATMELALLKFKKGPAFGEQRQDGTPLVEAIWENGKRATLIDRQRALTRFGLRSGTAGAGWAPAWAGRVLMSACLPPAQAHDRLRERGGVLVRRRRGGQGRAGGPQRALRLRMGGARRCCEPRARTCGVHPRSRAPS